MIRKRRRPEQELHFAICKHLRSRGAQGLVWWHTPNSGERDLIEAVNFKRMGVRAGVSDFIFLHNGRLFALEIKAEGGRPTEHQLQFLSDVNGAGGSASIAVGIKEALRVLETWRLLRGEAA